MENKKKAAETSVTSKSDTKPTRAPKTATKHLADRLAQIHRMLGEGELREAQAKYDIGSLVSEVQTKPGEEKYGAGAIEAMSLSLDLGESTLYDYGKVATKWDQKAFEKLLEKRNKNARPLSFSHLRLLATVESEKKLERLIEKTLMKSLSVRQLQELVGKKNRTEKPVEVQSSESQPEGIPEITAPAQATDLGELAPTLESLQGYVVRTMKNEEWWTDHLAKFEGRPVDADSKKTLATIRDSCRQWAEMVQSILSSVETMLKEAEAQASQVYVPTSSPVAPEVEHAVEIGAGI